jgi:hypothetical protein
MEVWMNSKDLPLGFEAKIHWVPDAYRSNPLSLQSGGCSVLIEFEKGSILGYDKIKNPSHYISSIMKLADNQKTEIIKIYIVDAYKSYGFVSKVYVKEYHGNDFQMVWDSMTSTFTPREALENFDIDDGYESRFQDYGDEYEYEYAHDGYSMEEEAYMYGWDPSTGISAESWIESQEKDFD